MTRDVDFTTLDQRPTLHDFEAVDRFGRARSIDSDRVRRMRYALYHLHEPIEAALARLAPHHAEELRAEFNLTPLRAGQRSDSSDDNSSKLVLSAPGGWRFETVLLRSNRRTSLCVSTQVGCEAGCPFCATARMGLQRNLTAAEIVEQVLIGARLAQAENRRVRNVVFMGMGEPLDNEQSLHAAIELLLSECRFPPRRLLVSTVGVPDAMIRFVDRFPGVHVALSLHSARPELRSRIVPRARSYSWQALHDALRYVADRHSTHRRHEPVMIEHIMLAGVNDGTEDAKALIHYLRGMRAHVNLIPYNPIPDGPAWRATGRPERDRFANQLRQAGIFTTVRYSMGADIQAACGQLVQNRL